MAKSLTVFFRKAHFWGGKFLGGEIPGKLWEKKAKKFYFLNGTEKKNMELKIPALGGTASPKDRFGDSAIPGRWGFLFWFTGL